jgi:hypothetical protein
MNRNNIYDKIYELEFCEPGEKARKEQELNQLWDLACKETNTPLYVLKPAILKTYPRYRANKLGKEMPELPLETRGETI